MTVFDLTGRTVLSTGACDNLNIEGLQAGSYILNVVTDQGVERATFIKTSSR